MHDGGGHPRTVYLVGCSRILLFRELCNDTLFKEGESVVRMFFHILLSAIFSGPLVVSIPARASNSWSMSLIIYFERYSRHKWSLIMEEFRVSTLAQNPN